MSQNTFSGNTYIDGNLSAKTFTPPAGSITNNAIAAATGIDATKLDHQYQKIHGQARGAINFAERKVLHVVHGATAEVVTFKCGNTVATTAGSSTTIDLLKNGTTILTATTVLNETNTAYTMEAAAGFTSTALVQGDVLEVNVTVSGGAPGNGLFCLLTVREDAQ